MAAAVAGRRESAAPRKADNSTSQPALTEANGVDAKNSTARRRSSSKWDSGQHKEAAASEAKTECRERASALEDPKSGGSPKATTDGVRAR